MVIRFLRPLQPLYFVIVLLLLCNFVTGQVIISGTVYDSTKQYVVPGVMVKSTGGGVTVTDSTGVYHINTTEKDSISFFYAGKPTQKFPVTSINRYNDFDISLPVRVLAQFRILKEVTVFSKSYKQDSADNRLKYSKIFGYQKPGIQTTMSPGGPAGLDLDELISIFNFRKNKHNLAFQKRLLAEEEEKYVNYKFNTTLLKRITGLSGASLDKYKMMYRPPYEFIVTATDLEFYEYILNTANKFKSQERLE